MRNKFHTTNFLLIAVALSLIILSLSAQADWEKTFGGADDDAGYSVQQTEDGGYIIVGQTSSFGAGGIDVYLLKTDASGNKQWQKTFGGEENDQGFSVQQTKDGGYIIAGNARSWTPWDCDVYLIKTDALGNKQWQKTFGTGLNDDGFSVQQTEDGGYIIGGDYGEIISLLKTDSLGNKEWDNTYFNDRRGGRGHSVQQTEDGGYILTGYGPTWWGEPGEDANIYLLKTDALGNKEWRKIFGGDDEDQGYSVQQTEDGGYIIAGTTKSFSVGAYDVYLIKTDALGNKQWQKTFGGAEDDFGYSVRQTKDSGYIIAGMTESFGAGGKDVYLIKTDASGNKQWQKTFGGAEDDGAYLDQSVLQTEDGGYIITGYTESFGAGGQDVYLIRIEAPTPSPPVSESTFTLSLDSGLNMVSLPLKPEADFTARSFAEKLGATTVIRYNTEKDKFSPFVPEVFSGDGFLIEGGQGYIVNLLESKDVVFKGTAWSNAPSKSTLASPSKENPCWAFIVCGAIYDEDRIAQRQDLNITAENLRTGEVAEAEVGQLESGRYTVSFVDLSRKDVVKLGDSLQVYFRDTTQGVTSEPAIYTVTPLDIVKGYIKVNLRMEDLIPKETVLLQNYPNPFNPETWIPFKLALPAYVEIRIYNLAGQLVRKICLGNRPAGMYVSKDRAAYWNGRNSEGEKVSSGIYFYHFLAGDYNATKRMLILK